MMRSAVRALLHRGERPSPIRAFDTRPSAVSRLWRTTRSVLVIDDIRLVPMLQLWRDLPFPKLDATSVGHWSGTGLALTG